ncbi:MAG TPA: lamin tail domain-containing protein, partial [Candidatus Nitrosotenuis sp.]|nr:lamin tail domain-containing protein [Candidatus Nitrosotenuis sp.]
MRPWLLTGVFAALLFFGVFTSSYAQELTDHVVINEVDTNPPGDDSKAISEWVELYNPTDETVDIGGWKVASTTILKKTLTIPVGTQIKPGQFLVYSYASLWFTDVSEKVQLRDNFGNVIDETPVITDQKNDFSSWQRSFDGVDSDASNDWTFRMSSVGSSNGRLETVSSGPGDLTISVDTNKQSYDFGETATISGKVSKRIYQEKPYFSQQQIKIHIDGPGSYDKRIILYPDLNLEYKTSLKLDKVLGVGSGTYDVFVVYDVAQDKTVFSVGETTATIITKEESELTVSSDNIAYIPGQRVEISASTTEIIPLTGLEYGVFDPNGNRIFSGKLYPTTKGDFSTIVYMTTVNPVFGTYDVVANYGKQHAETTFELVKDVKDTEKIVLMTDKPAYGLGDTVVISGRSNKYVTALDLEVLQTGATAIGKDTQNAFRIKDQVKLAG